MKNKSKFHQALHYYLGLAPHFDNYLNHSDARRDNNVAERAIRPLGKPVPKFRTVR